MPGSTRSPLEEVSETTLGEPVEAYAEPLSEEEAKAFDEKLDAVEPAYTAAAAKLHELFAG